MFLEGGDVLKLYSDSSTPLNKGQKFVLPVTYKIKQDKFKLSSPFCFFYSANYVYRMIILNDSLQPIKEIRGHYMYLLEDISQKSPMKSKVPLAVVQSLSHVRLFATSWTAACQASLSFSSPLNVLKLMSIESVMLSDC